MKVSFTESRRTQALSDLNSATGKRLQAVREILPADENALVGLRWSNSLRRPVPDEERAENEGFFATTTFFDAARSVPPLNDLAQEVMAMPSVISLITHMGSSTSYVFGWVEVKTAAGDRVHLAQPTYEFPLKVFFNGKLGTVATLQVTKPRPPLQICGGILAINAEYPGDSERRFRLRVIAARPTGQ